MSQGVCVCVCVCVSAQVLDVLRVTQDTPYFITLRDACLHHVDTSFQGAEEYVIATFEVSSTVQYSTIQYTTLQYKTHTYSAMRVYVWSVCVRAHVLVSTIMCRALTCAAPHVCVCVRVCHRTSVCWSSSASHGQLLHTRHPTLI